MHQRSQTRLGNLAGKWPVDLVLDVIKTGKKP